MKRHTIGLLLHPFKNRLLPRTQLKNSVDCFIQNLLSLSSDFPHLKFNLVLPAYILEIVNTILLSRLRDLQKRGSLEWLLTGYTEPFLSLSPFSLSRDNILTGLRVFSELTGDPPTGYLPPFSNWEPAIISMLRTAGLHYAVISRDLLPTQDRTACGYWIVEQAGDSLALITANTMYHSSAPADLKGWLEQTLSQDKYELPEKFIPIQYMIPLVQNKETDPFRWLRFAAAEIDKYLLNYQTVCFSEVVRSAQPLGLQFLPSSLQLGNEPLDRHFLNNIFSYDQIGILQRKLMDVTEQLFSFKEQKQGLTLKRDLYFVQDINRLLPTKDSGFVSASDRLWSYEKLIRIERLLHLKNDIQGGQIRITDFLKNGIKSIILSNKCLKLYIDNIHGGTIFECDYRNRHLNLCAAYNHKQHHPPNILVPGQSKTWFQDRLLPEECKGWDYAQGKAIDLGNFLSGQFDYKVRKTADGVKAMLVRRGSLQKGDRVYPISMEKVFGLEKDNATLSFVYQLSNPSLISYTFKFSTQLTFSLRGLGSGNVRLVYGPNSIEKLGWEYSQIESVTKWTIEDREDGIKLSFQTQKPFDIWIPQVSSPDKTIDPSQGISLVLSTTVNLEPSAFWKMIGKLSCKRSRAQGETPDAL